MGITLSLGALALAIAPTAGIADQIWYADFDKATAAAKEQGKEILVDFTGSDWCHWCIKLDTEVFEHEAFVKAASEDFILVKLDFPDAADLQAKVPNPERNEELKLLFNVTVFPTVMLVSSDGKPFAKTGYHEGGPELYAAHLRQIREEGLANLKAVEQVAAAFEQAAPEGKHAAMVSLIDTLAGLESDSMFVNVLAPIARAGLTMDPTNETGLKLKTVLALLAVGIADDGLLAAAVELDPTNADGLLERAADVKLSSVATATAVPAFVDFVDNLIELEMQDQDLAFRLFSSAALYSSKYIENNAEVSARLASRALTIEAGSDELQGILQEIANEGPENQN